MLAEPIGFDISNSYDKIQADLFNGLGRGFNTYKEDNLDMQLCYISQKLDKRAEDFILKLSEFIVLNREGK